MKFNELNDYMKHYKEELKYEITDHGNDITEFGEVFLVDYTSEDNEYFDMIGVTIDVIEKTFNNIVLVDDSGAVDGILTNDEKEEIKNVLTNAGIFNYKLLNEFEIEIVG